MKLLHSLYQKNKDFHKFLEAKKLSPSTFLFILFGSWLIYLGSAVYLGNLSFGSWRDGGRYFLIWLGWLAISFWLGRKPRYGKLIWYSNQVFLSFLLFFLIWQQPANWFLLFFEYNLLLFLILSWATACFLSAFDLSFPFILTFAGLVFVFVHNYLFFLNSSLAFLMLLLSIIFMTVITVSAIWNTRRVTNSLWNVYKEKQNLEETAQVLRIRIQARTKELRKQAKNLEKESSFRTQVLRERVQELERFRKATVGRELVMIKLKKEITLLKKEIEKLQHERQA